MKIKITVTGTDEEKLQAWAMLDRSLHRAHLNGTCPWCGAMNDVPIATMSNFPAMFPPFKCDTCGFEGMEVWYSEPSVTEQQVHQYLKQQGCAFHGGDSCHCQEANQLGTCEYTAKEMLRNKGGAT